MPDEQLHLYFCDVGQGDAEIITKGSVQIIIDGGPSQEKLDECMSQAIPFWDRKVELIMNSHPHKDHLVGLIGVIENYEVEKVVLNEVEGGDKEFERLLDLIKEKEVGLYQPQVGDKIILDDLEFRILYPGRRVLGATTTKTDLNEISLVVELKYGDFETLFTGDIGLSEELALIGSGVIKPAEVLKVAHHGSKNGSGVEFIEKLRPKLGIIEVGAKNSFGHPNGDVLKRFELVGTKVLRTDLEGTIEVVSDGEQWWVK